MSLLALLPPGLLWVDGIASGGLTSSMPSWLLVVELRVLGVETPARISDELLARARRGDMPSSLWKAVARAGMSVRSGERELPPSLNQLIGDAAAAGHIGKDEFAAHTITPFLFDIDIPERIHVGDDLVTGIRNTAGSSRFPLDMNWIWCRRIENVEVDGVPQSMQRPVDEAARQRWMHALQYSGNTVYGAAHPQADLTVACVPAAVATTAGEHLVRVTFEASVFNGPQDSSPGRAQITREFAVLAVPAGAELVAVSDSEQLLASIKEHLHPYVSHPQPGTPSWTMGVHDVGTYKQPESEGGQRIGGAWDVFVEFDGVRHPVGKYKLGFHKDGPHVSMGWAGDVKVPADIKRCRVVFVPNEKMAVERPALDMMHGDEIVIDVPVR